MKIATKLILAVLLSILPSLARADTSPRCGQAPNLACANGTQTANQDVSSIWNLKGSNSPLTLDGTTADANKITVSLSGDPAGSFTFTIPAGAASAAGQAQTCGAGNHISAFSATTGAFTCSADSGGTPSWNAITDPSGNQTLAMGNNTTTWTWSTATGAGTNMLTVKDTTANTGTGYVLALSTTGTSAAKPISITAGGTANGVDMGTTGILAKKGSGSVQADNIVFGSDATGDIPLRGASVYGRLAIGGANTVLHSNGTTASWASISSTDIGAGDLANALVWNDSSCVASPCTLPSAPRTADTALVFWRGVKLRRVTSCGGVNEYTLASTTLTLCDSTGIGAAPDNLQVTYEL